MASAQPALNEEEQLIRLMPLVRKIAKTFLGRLPTSIDIDDLISVGNIGALKSIRNYNPSYPDIHAYATVRIRGEIFDYLRLLDHRTRDDRRKIKAGKFEDIRTISYDIAVSEDSSTIKDFLPDNNYTPEARVIKNEQTARILKAIHQLPMSWRNRKIVEEYYFQETQMLQIGEKYHLRETRISQICTRAIQLLRERWPA